jgi:hypothetical protein
MDNFGTFAAWVSIVAVILSIPLSVIANLATPRVQSWIATTSKRRREQRPLVLYNALKELDDPLSLFRYQTKGFAMFLVAFCCFIAVQTQNTDIHITHSMLHAAAPRMDAKDGFHVNLLANYLRTARLSLLFQSVMQFLATNMLLVMWFDNRLAAWKRRRILLEIEALEDSLKLVDNSALNAETPIKPPSSQE